MYNDLKAVFSLTINTDKHDGMTISKNVTIHKYRLIRLS